MLSPKCDWDTLTDVPIASDILNMTLPSDLVPDRDEPLFQDIPDEQLDL